MKKKELITKHGAKKGKRSYIVFVILLFFAFFLHVQNMYSQEITITGIVQDEDGVPLPGANILVKGTNNGAQTDFDGNYSISVSSEATILIISYLGFVKQEIEISGRNKIDVKLIADESELDEIVIVGYGEQKKESLTAAISTVDTKDLTISSSPNLSTALAGQMPGLTVTQSSGQPGGDDVNLFLRGVGTLNDASPLILIDGIPRDGINRLDPNEIDTVTILKDASATAVFGVRGANGVIVITTRRGKKGESNLNVTITHSFQKFLTYKEDFSSWEFAELRNQAYLNVFPNTAPEDLPFTQYMIDKYKSGEDPVFYPNRDVYGSYFRDWAPLTRVNTNFNGGGDSFTYFLNAGYIGQGGNFKTEPESVLGYDPSYSMQRFNFRGNLDYDVTSNLKASLSLAGIFQKTNSPQSRELFAGDVESMIGNMIAYAWATPPTDPGPLTLPGYGVPEGEVLAQSGLDRNTYGEINRRGYRDATQTIFNSSLKLDWGLDFITEGLSAIGLFAFDNYSDTTLEASKGVNTYAFNVARNESETSGYSVIRNNQDQAIRLVKTNGTRYYTNTQLSLNYARNFGKHGVTAMALYQRDKWDSYGADLPFNLIGYVGRVTYNYDSKYLAEINFGYNGSEQFAPGNRFGSFPAYSLGWVASNEKFLENSKTLTFLKFRGSYGKVGNDKLDGSRFLYQSFLSRVGGQFPSLGNGTRIQQGRLGNESIQWESAEKINAGIDLKLFNNLSLSVDVFTEHRDKILIQRSTIPILQGVPLENIPKVNLGVVDNGGYEIVLGYRKMINEDFSFSVNGNYSYNENKIEFADEVQFGEEYAYRYRLTGFSIGQPFGYQIDYSNGNGYINTQEELDNLPTYEVGGSPRIGDFKYIDVNEDGIINDRDLTPIGYSSIPRISYGFSGNVNYKNFDMSFVFAGIAKSSFTQTGWGVTEFGLAGMYAGWHRKAWTPERYANGEEILYPALSTSAGVSQIPNNHFIMDRSFLRLKTLEIGYTLPEKLLNRIGIENTRIYVNGNNLFTWDKLPVNTIDPEQTNSLAYPLTKIIGFGMNITF